MYVNFISLSNISYLIPKNTYNKTYENKFKVTRFDKEWEEINTLSVILGYPTSSINSLENYHQRMKNKYIFFHFGFYFFYTLILCVPSSWVYLP